MKKTIFIMLSVLLNCTVLLAQESKPAPSAGTDSTKTAGTCNYQVGVHIGTQGFGVNTAWQFAEQFGVRLSGSYAPIGFNQTRTWGKTNYDADMDAKFGNVQLQLDFKPFKVGKSGKTGFAQKLAISVGAAYFFKREATVVVTPTNPYTYGEIVIQPSEIGTVRAHAEWKSFAPYAGLALRDMKLGKKLRLALDLGTYYLSSPKVNLDADKLLASNVSQQSVIQENLKDYRWLPVLQLGLAYQL